VRLYVLGTVRGAAMNAPELTPESVAAIQVWLIVAGILIAFIASPFILSWWLERKNRIMRSAHQYYCHRCRRGTNWSEDRKTCLECDTTLNGEAP